jgi:hypothetical protein
VLNAEPMVPSGRLRLARPIDLAAHGWLAWREQLFSDARR